MTTMAQLIIEVESRGLKRSNDGLQDLTQKADKAERKTKKLGDQSDKTSTQQKRLGDQSGKTGGMFDKQLKSSKGLIGKLKNLEKVVFGVAASFASIKVIGIADEMRTLDNIVGTVTDSERERVAVQKQLLGIANQNYAQLGATTELYVANRRALSELGKTQQQTLDFTDNLSKTFLIGGAAAESQAGAVRQLGQALASGALRGDEFNSIAENAPIILGLVAEELGVARGALRDMAADGAITSEVIFNAVSGSTELLSQMAADMDTTIKQAFTRASNNAKTYLGNLLNSTTGVTGQIAKVINFLGSNIENFANIALAGAAIAAVSFASSINVAAVAVKALGIVVATNPLFLAGAVLAAIAVKVMGVQGAMDSLGDAISIVGNIAGDLFNFMMKGFAGLNDLAGAVYTNVANAAGESTDYQTNAFTDFFSTSGKGFVGLLQLSARVFDSIALGARVMVSAVYNGIRGIITGIENMFRGIVNLAIMSFNDVAKNASSWATTILSPINAVRETLGKDPIVVNWEMKQIGKVGYRKIDIPSLSETIGTIADSQYGNGLESVLNGYVKGLGEAKSAAFDLTTQTDIAGASLNVLGDETKKAGKEAKATADQAKSLSEALKDLGGDGSDAWDKIQKRFDHTEQIRRDYDERYRIEKEHIDRVNAIRESLLPEAQKAAYISVSADRMGADMRGLDGRERRDRLSTGQQAPGDFMGEAFKGLFGEGEDNQILQTADMVNTMITDMKTGFTDAFAAGITGAQSMRETLYDMSQNVLSTILGQVVDMGVKWVAAEAMKRLGITTTAATQQATSAAATAAGVTQAGTLAAAYAPAATAASVATFGGAAGAGVTAMLGALAAVAGSSLLKGFESGGYTGNGGVSDVAGVVHGKEYVVNAPNTARYRPQLEAMNRGTYKEGGSEGGTKAGDNININVTINSDGSASVESAKAAGVKMGQIIKTAVQTELRKQTRQGGMLATV